MPALHGELHRPLNLLMTIHQSQKASKSRAGSLGDDMANAGGEALIKGTI